MRVRYSEEITHHTGLESCGGDGNILAEALTEEDTGGPLSSEITSFWVLTLFYEGENNMYCSVKREVQYNPTESENLACVETSYAGTGRSRRIPCETSDKEPSGKERFRTPETEIFWKSDNNIVPESQSNKGMVMFLRRLRREGR